MASSSGRNVEAENPEGLAQCLSTETPPCPVVSGLPMRAAVTTLTQNVLGSGVLALPFAMSSAGILGGLGLLIFVYLLSVFTMSLLVALSNNLGTFSYYGAARLTAGRRTAMWAEIWVLCTNIGLCISYVIVLGDFSFALAQKFYIRVSKEECMALLVGLVCWPLSCAPSLGFLRWMSMLGLLSVLFCTLVAAIRYWDGSYFGPSGPPVLSSFNFSSFGHCFPILVGAFGAHTNIPLLYKELAPGAVMPNWGRTEAGKADFWKMIKVISFSLTIACVVYGCHLLGRWLIQNDHFVGIVSGVGIIVYATFGSETKGDFSENFRPDDQLLVVLRVTMTLAICSSFALMMMSARAAACNLFLDPLGFAITSMSRAIVATFLTAICLGVAAVAKEIDTVLAYNGSVFATPVCFVAPPIMYLCLPRQSRRRSCSTLCVLSALAGLAFGLYGFFVTLTLDETLFYCCTPLKVFNPFNQVLLTIMDAADVIEKEAELAWKSRQFDLTKLAKDRNYFGPLGALPRKEPPSQDPALKFVLRACNRPLLLPEVGSKPTSAEPRQSTPFIATRCSSPHRSRPGSSAITSKDEEFAAEKRTGSVPTASDRRALRYQRLMDIYERACTGLPSKKIADHALLKFSRDRKNS